MTIDKNTVATLVYTINLRDASGEIIEDAQKEPKDLMFGFNKIIPGFENTLMGMKPGDDFSFTLNPAESFGNFQDDMLINVPKSAFMVNGNLREDLFVIGHEISMMDNHGKPLNGKVKEVLEDNIKMDFNHPLAGESLFIVGKVLNVRSVTAEDLEPKSGGCGCGSGDGECSTEKEEHTHDEGGCGCGSGCGC